MNEKRLFAINEVCKMLGTTSRTLRFYEQKGIVESTAVPFQTRRQYSLEQIEHIKKVLVLRSIGLPIAKIQAYQNENRDLAEVIAERQAEISALLISKTKEANLLAKALDTVKSGGDIFTEKGSKSSSISYDRFEAANTFTDLFLDGDLEACFSHFTEMLQDYMPFSVFNRVTSDTLKPIGGFVCKDKIERDRELNNVIYSFLKYEKLGLSIKLVFHRDKIHGIWLNYYELEGEK